MPQNQPIPSNIQSLYTVRLVMLLETGPQSNQYHQVALTQEQYRKLNDFLSQTLTKREGGAIAFPLNKQLLSLPEETREFI